MQEKLNQASLSRLVAAGTSLIYITTDNESRTEFPITRAALNGIKTSRECRSHWSGAASAEFPGRRGPKSP